MSENKRTGKEPPTHLTESTLRKWKIIQTAAIMPLILLVVFLFRFKGSMLGTVAFLLLFIVGIILPQIYRDFIRSHLALREELEEIRKQLSKTS